MHLLASLTFNHAPLASTMTGCKLLAAVAIAVLLHSPEIVQLFGDCSINDPEFRALTQSVYTTLSDLTATILDSDVGNRASFCVKDRVVEWDRAFNFSSNLDFLTSCIQKTNAGDVIRRVCYAAELKDYFEHFFSGSTYLKPNRNCNITARVSGCEPGWACAVSLTENVDMKLKDFMNIPGRTDDCQPCCEGFFCPKGLTCMIPCPLGAYCPTATLDINTGICKPYSYQLPPGMPNHTCGGANIWANVITSRDLFCSSGSYCPTSTQKIPCSNGHYCRLGSTSEKSCYKLISCDDGSSTKHIYAYGAMLIAAIFTILLIIYNCFDRVITTRERRYAKSREAAARHAKESVKALDRWKIAREAAENPTAQVSVELSILHQSSDDMDYNDSGTSNVPYLSSQENRLELKSQTFNSMDEDLYGFDHISKKKIQKEKQIYTHNQIFNYAYYQIEKEKAMQESENLTFSEVTPMAVNAVTRRRPKIEISFRDLTVTLKGKDRYLLRCVTGKIMPGRITAIMGPSGAGKTTFLSALTGKAHMCRITGSILINGKPESIHLYKKIIGFVPQDDIVHGNLTVEENLWFSANCRLPANMLKQDRVLVVERVIESLGLQTVRNSLVGTIEKRGISGGQRKRVNVGLEMVMEPSLLILDEPTSGLDSSSSQLLLRALRRETIEGVNVSMVVHQPSYSLFQKFDDLILLAKGGLTVYHGPARKAEEYFSWLGINVPVHVNPPDYFIDVLEGMVKLNTSLGVTYEQLPVRWMLHKGYHVPPDMHTNAAAMFPEGQLSVNGLNDNKGATEDHSLTGEIWEDVKSNVKVRSYVIRHNFLRTEDLPNRTNPRILVQYRYFLGRVAKQRLRESKLQLVDYLILLLGGACLGSINKPNEETFGALGYTFSIIAVSLLCKVAALRTFSLDKLQYWRERSSGINSFAHFLAKDTIDHFNTVVKPAVYLSMFFFFSNQRSSFAENYTILLALVYCVTGIAYMLYHDPGSSQLVSNTNGSKYSVKLATGQAKVGILNGPSLADLKRIPPKFIFAALLPVVLTLIPTQTGNSKFLKIVSNLCYPKWTLEAFVISNANRFSGVWLITRCGALQRFGYNVHDWGLCIFILIMIGLGSRILAFIGMLIVHKR